MAQSIDIKRNDTGIGIEAILSDSEGPMNLTGATVRFLYEGNVIVCQLQDAATGVVLVPFQRVNTQKDGVYQAEFEVDYGNGINETVPSNGYVTLSIHRDLGGVNNG
jgi:hypothetical protein